MNNFTYKSELFENYDAYENMAHDRLTLEDANRIFTEYHDSLDFSEEYFREEYSKLVSHAIRYAGIRVEWSGFDREEKMREDASRTNAHNMFLNDVERYAGYMKRNGKDIKWFEELGQGIEPEEINLKRKRIGDWACYIALFVALNQR